MSLLDINLYKGETPFLQNIKNTKFELLANYNKVVWNLKKGSEFLPQIEMF